MAIKLEGGGGLGLNGPAIKRRTFFAASLSISIDFEWWNSKSSKMAFTIEENTTFQ